MVPHFLARSLFSVSILAIRSDGWVQRQSQEYESGPRDKWHKRLTETYELSGTNSGHLIQKMDFGKEAHAGEIR
jgi:hypothetical protein